MLAPALALLLALGVDPADEEEMYFEEEKPHVRITATGGSLLNRSGEGSDWVSLVGGQLAWVRDSSDVGVLVQGYRGLEDGEPDRWSPVVLLRFEQRFESRRGLGGALALGLGAARPRGWQAWYQFALGVRYAFGPAHVGGEIGFEQSFLVRLAASLGVAF